MEEDNSTIKIATNNTEGDISNNKSFVVHLFENKTVFSVNNSTLSNNSSNSIVCNNTVADNTTLKYVKEGSTTDAAIWGSTLFPPFVINLSVILTFVTLVFRLCVFIKQNGDKKKERKFTFLDKYYFEDLIRDDFLKDFKETVYEIDTCFAKTSSKLDSTGNQAIDFISEYSAQFTVLAQSILDKARTLRTMDQELYLYIAERLEKLEDDTISSLVAYSENEIEEIPSDLVSFFLYDTYLSVLKKYGDWVATKPI